MREKYPISVIIPCYCCSETLEFAVNSVWNQSALPKEVILIDDASDDENKTKNEMNRIKELYPKNWIKCIFLENNSGPGNARNVGWSHATEEYIAFLDSDDSWHNKKIEIQYNIMKSKNIDITFHRSKELNDRNHSDKYSKLSDVSVKEIYFKNLLISNCISTRSVMLKKSLKNRFDSNKYYAEDYLLWLEIIKENNFGLMIELYLAFSYKNIYDKSGLSGNLIKMEKGELDTYKRIYKYNYINTWQYSILKLWSILKFLVRVLKSKFAK